MQSSFRSSMIRLSNGLEIPMVILGIVWLVLVTADLIGRSNHWLISLGTIIWLIFIFDFLIKLTIAKNKRAYIKNNALVLVSIAVPALRVLRFGRALTLLRFTRSFRLVRIITSFNRGMRSLGEILGRGRFHYVIVLTLVVVLLGASGIYALEKDSGAEAVSSYGSSLWWTAMMITTMGSDYWPKTVEGRILAFLLALYAFTIFGYITAMLATFFIGHQNDSSCMDDLKAEIKKLREAVENPKK